MMYMTNEAAYRTSSPSASTIAAMHGYQPASAQLFCTNGASDSYAAVMS
jgi:hypothetical protein